MRDVTIAGTDITGHCKDGRAFQSPTRRTTPASSQTLYKKDVTITAKPPSDGNTGC